jgi:hypothetical protein
MQWKQDSYGDTTSRCAVSVLLQSGFSSGLVSITGIIAFFSSLFIRVHTRSLKRPK